MVITVASHCYYPPQSSPCWCNRSLCQKTPSCQIGMWRVRVTTSARHAALGLEAMPLGSTFGVPPALLSEQGPAWEGSYCLGGWRMYVGGVYMCV